MRQCLLTNGILLSDEELYALEERFNDDVGFNYFWFLKEVDPNVQEEPLVNIQYITSRLSYRIIVLVSRIY